MDYKLFKLENRLFKLERDSKIKNWIMVGEGILVVFFIFF